MYYVTYDDIIMNTMLTIHKREERRIIDKVDVKNYEKLVWEKFKKRNLRVNYHEWDSDYEEMEELFQCTSHGNNQDMKKVFRSFFLDNKKEPTKEILKYLCPYRPFDNLEESYYMMLPWLGIEDLHRLRGYVALPVCCVFSDINQQILSNIPNRTDADLEKLSKYEKRLCSFFQEMVEEEIDYYKKKVEESTKKLRKMEHKR